MKLLEKKMQTINLEELKQITIQAQERIFSEQEELARLDREEKAKLAQEQIEKDKIKFQEFIDKFPTVLQAAAEKGQNWENIYILTDEDHINAKYSTVKQKRCFDNEPRTVGVLGNVGKMVFNYCQEVRLKPEISRNIIPPTFYHIKVSW